MSIKWYEEHVEDVIRENQQLRFQIKKMQKDGSASGLLIQAFRQLFPDVPALDRNDAEQRSFSYILEYYQKVISLWLERQKSKLDFLLSKDRQCDKKVIISKSSSYLVNRTIKERERRCILCDNARHDRSPSLDLQKRINELEKQIRQLQEEMKMYELNQQKYLKEIAQLRSITKKMEFELSERMLFETKCKNRDALKDRKKDEEILELKREVCIWRGEYQRIWKDQQVYTESSEKQEYTQVNTSRKQVDTSSNSSHIWIIREGELEHSYFVQANTSETTGKSPLK